MAARMFIALSGAGAALAAPTGSADGVGLTAQPQPTANAARQAAGDAQQTAVGSAPVGSASTQFSTPAAAPSRGLGPEPSGLLSFVNRYSNSGPYGAPLISGCSWATWVPQCANLTVYGNGSSFSNSGCGPPNGCKFGPEFQCVELVQRYAYYAWGEPASWFGFGGADGNAASFWVSGPALPTPLQRFANGGGVPPQQGDILVFGPGWLGSFWDGAGHVAVVRAVGQNYVDIVQENGTPGGTDRFALAGSLVTAGGYTPLLGWLRNTQQTPVAVGGSNVAGTPQAVSERAGEMDVVWRGTDQRLWAVGYRNGSWGGAQAISPATVASDPAVVSAGTGQLDAFWQGGDGNLWHVGYQAGWYGSGSWSTPVSLGVGPVQSAPHAVAVGGGVVDVVWQGPGGSVYLDRYSGSGGGAVALGGVSAAGEPAVVAEGGGISDVFWRDGVGNLWTEQVMSWGAGPAQLLGDGPLASDPIASSAGDGSVDVFWRGNDGGLWHAGRTAAGSWSAPGSLSGQAMLGRPSVVAPASGTATVVVQRGDGKLASLLELPGIGWVGPELLGDGPVGSDPSVVSYATTASAVFWRGADGGLWWSPACPGCAPPPPAALQPLH